MLPVKLMQAADTAERRQYTDETQMQMLRGDAAQRIGVSGPHAEEAPRVQAEASSPQNGFGQSQAESSFVMPRDEYRSTFGDHAKSAREMPRDEYKPSYVGREPGVSDGAKPKSAEETHYDQNLLKGRFLENNRESAESTFVPKDPFGKELEILGDARPAQKWEEELEEFKNPLEEESCKTCTERKYVDRSNDMDVSFQTPSRVAPQMAIQAVKQHEQQHVREHQRIAESKGLKVLSQTVTVKYAICPCCGQRYVKGGLTHTVTANKGYEIYKQVHGEGGSKH